MPYTGVSTSEASKGLGKRDEVLANARFLMPLLMVLVLAGRHKLFEGDQALAQPFHLLQQPEFLAGVGGLLTNRLSLFYTEILGQMTQADWLSFLPGIPLTSLNHSHSSALHLFLDCVSGSFAESLRQKETLSKTMSGGMSTVGEGQSDSKELVTVVCVSGPLAGGRTAVVERLFALNEAAAEQRKTEKFKRTRLDLRPCVYVTPDAALVQARPDRYKPISAGLFADLQVVADITREATATATPTESDALSPPVLKALYKGAIRNLFTADSPVSTIAHSLLTSYDCIAGGLVAEPAAAAFPGQGCSGHEARVHSRGASRDHRHFVKVRMSHLFILPAFLLPIAPLFHHPHRHQPP